MSKALFEIRVFPKNALEGGTKRPIPHADHKVLTFLVRAASVSFALIALEDDEDMIPATEVGRIEVNPCTRYTKFIGAQESI